MIIEREPWTGRATLEWLCREASPVKPLERELEEAVA